MAGFKVTVRINPLLYDLRRGAAFLKRIPAVGYAGQLASPGTVRAYLALASVCFFWGTTYMAIKIALESFPAAVLVSGRFLVSGGLMLAAAWLSRQTLPRGWELVRSAFYGAMILGIGNGCLVYSELMIPSSLAALFIAASPFWMVGIEALFPGGERLRGAAAAGMLTGLAGVLVLVVPGVARDGLTGNVVQGFLLLQLGAAGWSLGSILQRRQATQVHPVVSGAVQQIGAGLAFLPAALLADGPVDWTAKGVGAFAYLVVFGTIVGYSSYLYALRHLPVALVSVYTYVNPVVAAYLGWIFYREPFGGKEITAMAVIFLGVAVVKRFSTPSPVPSHPARPRPSESP
jgi:drug/metabolite transporter (DMT)-like permease